MTGQVRVFLLDDHTILREGTRRLIEADESFTVVGEAASADEAVTRILHLEPDVALLDIELPDGNGIDVCRRVKQQKPAVACVILTGMADDQMMVDSIAAGSSGFMLKQIGGDELLAGLRTVAAGGSLIDPTIVSRVLANGGGLSDTPDPLDELSDREVEILKLIGSGLTNRQIGDQVYLSERTVKNYVSKLLRKLGLERRTQAAVVAERQFGAASG